MSERNLPLWEAMEQARDAVIAAHHPFAREEQCLAAEISAVRDYIITNLSGEGWQTWQIRQLVDLLNEEADRAERGEVDHA